MRDGRAVRIIAALAAIIGWSGLLLQFELIVENLGSALGLWRLVGYFTILTNLGAAAVATAIALGRRSGLGGSRSRLMAATSILMVGLVYSLVLRSLWNPTGLQKVADILLHDATPLLWLALWLVSAHPRYRWQEIGWALLPGLLYCGYALARGSVDGWYAYWFLNPTQQSPAELLAGIATTSAAFALVAALLIGFARWRTPARERSRIDPVDEASLESFPASDPPSWTLGEDRKD